MNEIALFMAGIFGGVCGRWFYEEFMARKKVADKPSPLRPCAADDCRLRYIKNAITGHWCHTPAACKAAKSCAKSGSCYETDYE